MRTVLAFALVASISSPWAPAAHADDWRSKYSTGRKAEEFEACCGHQDCRTAASLGYPKMTRRPDGGYDVMLGKYRLHYDFPAVHPSEDSRTWVCYMETYGAPEPLCLFLPPGII